MPSDSGPLVAAVFNTSPDIVDMLRIVLEHAGFVVVSLLTWEVRDGEVDVETFLRQHKPDVVVYDLAPPYDANWRLFLFQHICRIPAMRSGHIVLTSANPSRVAEIAGRDTRVYEIVGKPYDLDQIVTAVREAAHARPTR